MTFVQRRKSVSLIVVAAAAFSTAGCAPDGGKTDPGMASRATVSTPQSAVLDGRPLIICFGDSLTQGHGTDPGESYPDYLQTMLTADGYPYHVINSGIDGNTTKDGLDRIGRVIARRPALVVLEFGGNDGLRGLPLTQTRANLAAMIEQLQQSHIPVALAGISLPQDYGPDYIRRFTAMYPELAAEYHVRLLPILFKNVYGLPGMMQDDHTHATAKGNQQVAANVYALIQPMLKR